MSALSLRSLRAGLARAAGVLAALAALPAAAQDPLPAAVQAALERAQVPAAALGAIALPLARQGLPWRHQALAPMQPGSTMKLVTSVVALDRLGPNHRGHTALLSSAPLDGEVLRGDLVLQGGVDPDLGLPQFWALLLELRQQGIGHITGDLVIDRHAWRPARPDLGVPPFDEAPEFPYNVIPDALQLLGGLLPLELRSTATGGEARSLPALPGLDFDSRMGVSERRCADWDDDWQPAQLSVGPAPPAGLAPLRITLAGAFPRDCVQRAQLQLLDRTLLAERVFAALWQGLGGRWDGRAREAEAALPADATRRVLARREARPWGEVLRELNKRSDNALTRMLYLSLGMPAMGAEPQAHTAELAAREVRRWFDAHHIDSTGLVLDNGSGLSRSERISPWQLAQLLQVAHRGRHAPELLMSLPVAGVDGTMRNRLKDGPATGWARLKTGTLRNVVALAGYVNDDSGRPWAVVAIVNHDNAPRARPVLDAFMDWVARGGPRPGRAPASP